MHRFTPPTPVDTARRDTIRLLFHTWEIGCCVPPPAVGEDTFFTLSFHADAAGLQIPGLTGSHTWTLHPLPDESDGTTSTPAVLGGGSGSPLPRPALASRGGVYAYWKDAPAIAGPVTVTGFLTGLRHGGLLPDNLPITTGEVVRIQVVRRTFAETEPGRHLEPVPGSAQLRDIERSPRWFDRTVLNEANPHRVSEENALLIDLRVPSTQ
jgi:hypothetical protein